MNIKITNDNCQDTDLDFTQPKFYFGQLLQDKENQVGIVFEMCFHGVWDYQIFYLKEEYCSKSITEEELVDATLIKN